MRSDQTYAAKQLQTRRTPCAPFGLIFFTRLEDYLVTADYHFGFIEVDLLPVFTTDVGIGKLKREFSRHEITETDQ